MMKRLACLLALVLPVSLGCTSETTSTKGQLIECAVDANGNTSNCQPADSDTPAPGTCHDIDEDGDDDPADTEEEGDNEFIAHPGDDDNDGTPDSEDDDDDNDGVDDADDCDELPGHDDDDADDAPEAP